MIGKLYDTIGIEKKIAFTARILMQKILEGELNCVYHQVTLKM